MPTLDEPLPHVERARGARLLAESAGMLVDHLTQSIQRLRHLHQALDVNPSGVEARRVLGAEFESAAHALAVAQSFELAIGELDDGPVTVSALLNDEIIAANMASWVRSVDEAHRLVIADLTAVDALATSFPALDSPSESSRQVAAELIASLARNAIDRLDIAHPSVAQ